MEENIFGTDGIRGKSNTYPIDAETILKIGFDSKVGIAHLAKIFGNDGEMLLR